MEYQLMSNDSLNHLPDLMHNITFQAQILYPNINLFISNLHLSGVQPSLILIYQIILTCNNKNE